MRLLGGQGDGSTLGITALGSFLFSDRAVADVISCKISNRPLLTAIRALSQTYDDKIKAWRNVDYRNLGPEELGSVYESLLELHPEINTAARTFALSSAGGNERKTTGSYYTPTSLINALLDSALDPVLDEAAKKGAEAILDLKVCDPACGSGHFLIAAANRMAKRLASIRSGELEPPPPAIQTAKREIIGRCIYGVDINPMAAELCKVSLWMEALDPGKPLSFLDHHIQVGNSLLGTTPKLMQEGIPNDAFEPIEGDDKKQASALRKQNKNERKQRDAGLRQLGLEQAPAADYGYLSDSMQMLASAPDESLDDVRQKEAFYAELARDDEYIKARLLADAWCSAFVWQKRPHPKSLPDGSVSTRPQNEGGASTPASSPSLLMGEGAGGWELPLTDLLYRHLERDPQAENLQTVRKKVVELTDRYGFFHWHVAFSDVFQVPDDLELAENEAAGWNGGFDVVLGNPPWERIKIQEKEWFAQRDPAIAGARNAAERRRMIAALADTEPILLQAFAADKREAEGKSHFTRKSGRFPLCGRGDVNTYTVFAETARNLLNCGGRVGIILPTGIVTDDTTKFFLQDLMKTSSIVSLYDFENRKRVFPAVEGNIKFCLLTMTNVPHTDITFGAQLDEVSLLQDRRRQYTLSVEDIRAINPNTMNCPMFVSDHDASIVKYIHHTIPIAFREYDKCSPWGVSLYTLFHMTNDSDCFCSLEQLRDNGWQLRGNTFVRGGDSYIPLYEAKLVHQFNHRSATFEGIDEADRFKIHARTNSSSFSELHDPNYAVLPRHWIPAETVEKKYISPAHTLIGFRNAISAVADSRSLVATIFPKVGVGNSLPLVHLDSDWARQSAFVANLNCITLDYVLRQKASGGNLNFYILKQLPVIPPHTYAQPLLDFITPRVLELSYTAWDLQPFARDLDYQGAPFVWDEARRFLLRCELDALYFHLYGIERDDVAYILETFPIVKKKDVKDHCEYRTKRVILEMYDLMADLPTMQVPAPKPEHGEMAVPDVSQWVTPLDPPPADPRAAHEVE